MLGDTVASPIIANRPINQKISLEFFEEFEGLFLQKSPSRKKIYRKFLHGFGV